MTIQGRSAGRTVKGAAAALVLAAAAFPGCASMSGTEKGVVLGGLAGAGLGRAIGHHNGSARRGGWAGAGIGAVMGGLIGALADESSEKHTVAPVDLDDGYRAPRRAERVRYVEVEEELPPVPRTRTVTRTTTTVTRTYRVPETREVIYVEDCD